jgi:hypothetical protein
MKLPFASDKPLGTLVRKINRDHDKLTNETRLLSKKIHMFQAFVNDLSDMVDYKLENPHEKDYEEI